MSHKKTADSTHGARAAGEGNAHDGRRLRQLAAEYRVETGLPVIMVGRDGETLWKLGGCPLSRHLSPSSVRDGACREHHRKAIEESMRWGEPYIDLCPFGMVTFGVPLVRDKSLDAGFLSGFSIFPQMEPDALEEMHDKAGRLGVQTDMGPRSRLRFRVVSSASLRRNASLLFDMTVARGRTDGEHVSELREKSAQQLAIAAHLAEAREGDCDLLTSLVSMQNEIIDKVVLGDLTGFREIINRFLGVIFLESGMNFDMLKVRLLELLVVISRSAMSRGIGAEGLLGPRYSYLTDISAASGFDDLFWRTTKALENFTRAVSEARGRMTRARMTRMRDFLRRNLAAKVSAADVAAAAGLSVGRALHLFRKEAGMSLSAYILRERIACARSLLRSTDRSMADIAAYCGFFDQSHFTKSFRAVEGTPPLRYRERLRAARRRAPDRQE